MLVKVNLLVSNNQLESRMREIRQSGSVGGKPQPNAASLPQSGSTRFVPACGGVTILNQNVSFVWVRRPLVDTAKPIVPAFGIAAKSCVR